MSRIKNIHMVVLMQSDLQAAILFYEKLGLALKFHLRNAWAEMMLGDVKIGLCPGQVANHHTGVVFEVDDINEFYEEHKDEITFLNQPVEKVHGIMLSAQDPSGNIIDFYQPTPEKLKDLIKTTQADGAEAES